MRTFFYTNDPDVEVAIADLVEMLRSWGIRGSNADAIRYAIRYTAEAHGLIPGGVGREVVKADPMKVDGHVAKNGAGRKNPSGAAVQAEGGEVS
jgi:Arc/MetJ-type ribon-helix-helix transcriptional regulator